MPHVRVVSCALFVVLSSDLATAQQGAPHLIVPPNARAQHGVETVSGDPSKAGAPFVVRIHNDAGYICAPHTHPTDEHIVVVKGTWSAGMGTRINRSALEVLEVGAYGLVPKQMAHFCRSRTATTLQVHGIGPFGIDLVDPLYQLTEKGVSIWSLSGGTPVAGNGPAGCFVLQIGDGVRGALGEGRVVGAECSPSNNFTQYWIQTGTGGRFWATSEELKKL